MWEEIFLSNLCFIESKPIGLTFSYCLKFRELPEGILDGLSFEEVLECNTEDESGELVKQLLPIPYALLNWAVNIMADVVEEEDLNKMNTRNIAMVFAPNITQMSSPLTALMHIVQVMNLLKTLIIKTFREREETATEGGYSPFLSHYSNRQTNDDSDSQQEMDTSCKLKRSSIDYDDNHVHYSHSSEDEEEVDLLNEIEESFLRQLDEKEEISSDCPYMKPSMCSYYNVEFVFLFYDNKEASSSLVRSRHCITQVHRARGQAITDARAHSVYLFQRGGFRSRSIIQPHFNSATSFTTQRRWASQSAAAIAENDGRISIGPRGITGSEEDKKDTGIVYCGPISSTIKKVKLLSLSTCCLSVSLGPVITFMTSPDMNVIFKGAVASSVIFLSATTTGSLHWFVSPYIHKLRWQPGSDSFEVDMMTWLATFTTKTIKFSDIKRAETNRPFVTFMANKNFYFVDTDHCHNKALLAKLTPQKSAHESALKNL
ncbi:hypothetical protein GIB67_030270 [Kingdonia uniflora]|uniref:Rho-GAP domain-containing protein n=1 Tax=Kingdonia uniflora TaxID=39325 RepID=A0A7J7M6G1_9MAGN|nr:hypothetical protein GIB67_030270 [Kingdonia uniflora]